MSNKSFTKHVFKYNLESLELHGQQKGYWIYLISLVLQRADIYTYQVLFDFKLRELRAQSISHVLFFWAEADDGHRFITPQFYLSVSIKTHVHVLPLQGNDTKRNLHILDINSTNSWQAANVDVPLWNTVLSSVRWHWCHVSSDNRYCCWICSGNNFHMSQIRFL